MKEVILELIEQGRYAEVRNKIAEMNEVDIAQILEETDKHKLLVILGYCQRICCGVFSYISYELQRYIVESITDSEIKNILDELFLDDTIDFWRKCLQTL